MRVLRIAAALFLAAVFAAVLAADWLAPQGFAVQERDAVLSGPSAKHWLGTDELGRDRFARLIYGARISLLLAPGAALVAMTLAACLGLLAAWAGGWIDTAIRFAMDVMQSVPWLFLLIAVRAALPMNLDPGVSLGVTFVLLALLGWAGPARVIANAATDTMSSGFVLRARAGGSTESRVLRYHLLPTVMPLLRIQFWMTAPVFLLSEANLGIVGLGVSPPAPSLGGLIVELQSIESVIESPAKLLAPLLLITVAAACRVMVSREGVPA
jgi:ABC-type dipeptide/oligopeptide/nickel transport system permease subunit